MQIRSPEEESEFQQPYKDSLDHLNDQPLF